MTEKKALHRSRELLIIIVSAWNQKHLIGRTLYVPSLGIVTYIVRSLIELSKALEVSLKSMELDQYQEELNPFTI